MYSIWSTAFLDYEVSSYTCFVNEKEWFRLNNDFNTSKMFVRIYNNDKYWICALDSPSSNIADNSIYVPPWMLDQIGCEGIGEELHIEFMPTEAFDHSTKIVLESITIDEIYDMQEVLSNELTKLAILQKGTFIRVFIDDFEMLFKVISLEPASVVLCEGDDVCLEFYKAVDLPIERVDTPIPSPIDYISSGTDSLETQSFTPTPVRFNPWRNKDFKPYMS